MARWQRRPGLRAAALLALAACAAPAAPPRDDDWQTDLDRHVLGQLTATREAGPLVVHYRPGDLDEATLRDDVAANLADFEELQHKLDMQYVGPIHIFLYRDKEDMRATTEGDADIAFSTGRCSIHQLHDFRGVHEMTHVFSEQFPPNPDGAGADLFATEGLATAMAASDQDVGVHAWAAMYLRLGRMPDLTALRGNFMGTAGKGVHPYHVAASFILRLVERFGIERVKAWYVNSGEAGQVFGVSFARLERDWLEFLASYPVAEADAEHVRGRFGRKLEAMPEAWRTAAGTPLYDGHGLDALQPDEPARWSLRDGLLVGENDGPWTPILSRDGFGPDVGLRVRFRLVSGDAVQLRVARGGGHEGQAIFARWNTYLSVGDEGFTQNEEVKVPPGVWIEAILVDVGGRGRLFLDGVPLLDEADALPAQAGQVGIAVERGVVEVAEITAFTP